MTVVPDPPVSTAGSATKASDPEAPTQELGPIPAPVAPSPPAAPAPAASLPAGPQGAGRRPAGRMSRVGRLVCLGAGCFALAVAALLPLVVYPRLAVLPDDPQQEQLLSATGATALVPDAKAPAGARVVRDTDVTISNFVSEAAERSGDSVVWQIATRVDLAGEGMINARVEKLSLNRRTAEPTNCCGDRIVTSLQDTGGDRLTHKGYVAMPFNVQKKSYQLWDVNLQKTKTARYVGEATRDGIHVYKFRAVVPLQTIGTMDLPGGLFGLKDPSVTADTQYADTQTYWIEPQTGDVIALDDRLTQQYIYQGKTLTALDASLHSPRLSDKRLSDDRIGAVVLPWTRSRASLVLVPLGLILLVAGGVLGRSRRRANG